MSETGVGLENLQQTGEQDKGSMVKELGIRPIEERQVERAVAEAKRALELQRETTDWLTRTPQEKEVLQGTELGKVVLPFAEKKGDNLNPEDLREGITEIQKLVIEGQAREKDAVPYIRRMDIELDRFTKGEEAYQARRELERMGKPEIGGGAGGWLIRDPKELVGIRRSDKFKRALTMIDSTPSNMITPQWLRNMSEYLLRVAVQEKVDPIQMQRFQERMSGKIQQLAPPQERVFPTDKNEQTTYVRSLLEKIEAQRYQLGHTSNADFFRKLEEVAPLMDDEVRLEYEARIRLHDTHALLAAVGGRSEDYINGLRAAANELRARNHYLEGKHFALFLKTGLPGLKIPEAFARLQEAAVHGIDITRDNGKVEKVKYSQKGLSAPEQQRLESKIIGSLGGDKTAKQSLEFARKMAFISFETSVWNQDLLPGDPVAEAFYFRKFRESRFASGKDRGPNITVKLIEGFGTSFLRSPLPGDRHLFFEKERKNAQDLANKKYKNSKEERKAIEEVEGKTLELNRANSVLNTTTADFEQLTGEYLGYLGGTLPGILAAKDLLLKTDWKPTDITLDTVEGWITPFDSADPKGLFRMRAIFVLGLLDEGLNRGERLAWGQIETRSFLNLVTRTIGEKEGKQIGFIAESEREWIGRVLKIGRRSAWNDFLIALQGTTRIRR